MARTSWIAPAFLAGTLSLGCLSDITIPGPGPAFTTNALAYTLEGDGTSKLTTVSWTYVDFTGEATAIQGCTGGAARWFLEKKVGDSWLEVYPVCTANDAAGIAVVSGGSYEGSAIITDVITEGGSPRISHRPVAGTYRLRFGLYEDLNFATGTGTAVTDDRRYSNEFTLQ